MGGDVFVVEGQGCLGRLANCFVETDDDGLVVLGGFQGGKDYVGLVDGEVQPVEVGGFLGAAYDGLVDEGASGAEPGFIMGDMGDNRELEMMGSVIKAERFGRCGEQGAFMGNSTAEQ